MVVGGGDGLLRMMLPHPSPLSQEFGFAKLSSDLDRLRRENSTDNLAIPYLHCIESSQDRGSHSEALRHPIIVCSTWLV